MEKGTIGVFQAILSFNKKEIVLVKQVGGKWGLPGGGMCLGENPLEAVVRETREETGLFVVETGFVGCFGLKKSFGVVLLFESVINDRDYHLVCRWLRPDGKETEDARFFPIAEAEEMNEKEMIYPAQFGFIQWVFMPVEGRPYFGSPAVDFIGKEVFSGI